MSIEPQSSAERWPDLHPDRPCPEEYLPDLTDVETETEEPLDSIYQEKQLRLLVGTLHASWQREHFVAMANVGLFYREGHPPFVPDVIVSLDVDQPTDPFPKKNRSYFTWIYGKPPECVVEVVSNTRGGELHIKLPAYHRIGIDHYVVWDPERRLDRQRLRVFTRQPEKYVEHHGTTFLSGLGLGVCQWSGRFEGLQQNWVRWCDADGVLIPTAEERAEAERERAEAERQRAEAERQRAEAERERADRLAARLRELGVDPNA